MRRESATPDWRLVSTTGRQPSGGVLPNRSPTGRGFNQDESSMMGTSDSSGLRRRSMLGGLTGLAAIGALAPARAAIVDLVAIGRDGWLFPIWDEVRDIDLKRIGLVAGVCRSAIEALAQANIQVAFAVTPAKSRVYRAMLPDDFKFGAEPEKRYQAALDALNGISFAPDLLAPLVAKRDADKAEPVFFKADTHWTGTGAQAAASELARQLQAHYQAPASAQTGTKLASSSVQTWERNDLADLLPAAMSGKYSLEDYRLQQPAAAGGAALLEDDAADVVVVGNSFTQPKLGFAPMLSNKMNRPVGLFWKVHQFGPYQTLLGYLASESFRRKRPALIVWNFHETDVTVMPERRDVWVQNAMPAQAFLGKLKQTLGVS